jgi:predicted nucleic acid-binding protein
MTSTAVIDANIAIYAVLPSPFHQAAISLLRRLVEEGIVIYVPHLWLCEVGSGIRKIATLTRLPEEQKILQAAFDLPVEIADEDYDLYLSAYKLAKELNQKTIYDAIYIALANRVNGVFFTADRSLYHNCRNKRIGNVYLLE